MAPALAAVLAVLLSPPARALSADDAFARSLAVSPSDLRAAAALVPAAAVTATAVDATGRPVSPATLAAHQALLASLRGRRPTPAEKDFLLVVLNQPPVPPGPFRGRDALVRHFAAAGVGVPPGQDAAGADLWRLVRAARAASAAYRIPPAVLLCLTFRESGFRRGASAWTTSAKGVSQLTNPAVAETARLIARDPALRAATERYAAALGARVPERVEGAADVDALTREIEALRRAGAPAARLAAKKAEREAAIKAHKDEPGHIYNLETNFGLGAAYLSYLRTKRLAEVRDETKGWLTAVAAYNQGIGYANKLVYDAHGGPAAYEALSLDAAFSPEAVARLGLPADRQHELLGEVGSVRACACP